MAKFVFHIKFGAVNIGARKNCMYIYIYIYDQKNKNYLPQENEDLSTKTSGSNHQNFRVFVSARDSLRSDSCEGSTQKRAVKFGAQ